MKILFAASEAVPFCKTGGLADVVGALVPALKARRHDARLILPKYRSIDPVRFGLKQLDAAIRVPFGDSFEAATLWEGRIGRAPAYFVDCPKFFDRPGLYGEGGADYADNDERFILFSRAVLEAAKAIDFRPDIFHCHDWQTGLVSAYLETLYRYDAFFAKTSSLFTIHNIAYQGIFSKDSLFLAGFSWADFTPEKLEFYDQVNFLKAGLVYAQVLNTVSPTYAREIQSDPLFGCGLEGVLKARSKELFGVLNGLDVKVWDPATDIHLSKPFSSRRPDGRAECKNDLQRLCGLGEDPAAPLIGMVTRLDVQKGVDLALLVIERFISEGAQFVVLGQGDKTLKAGLELLAKQYPGRVHYSSDFNEPLAHKIYGGADIFLMPSRFEPCGLSQMISLRYGTIPVVTPTGGLIDTVSDYTLDPAKGLGFMTEDASATALSRSLAEAVALLRARPKEWRELQRRGMARDFSWKVSIPKYVELYRRALEKKSDAKDI